MKNSFETLRDHKYCQLASFRRDGRVVDTPVWFALDGERLYVKTEDPSGKVRRIRRDARVRVAACTMMGKRLGSATDGVARVLTAGEEKPAEAVLRRRYGLGRRLFCLLVEPLLGLRGQRQVYLEIVPAAHAAASSGAAKAVASTAMVA